MNGGYQLFRPRSEDVYDWSGGQLHPEIRQLVTVGNVVRVQVSENGSAETGWSDTPYLRVTLQDGDRLTGVVDDPYRSQYSALDNGTVIEFDRADVTEIPLDWTENEALAPSATHTGRGREITGYIAPD
ncbi:hypothetical protein GCM10010413_46910 [Promicromonospora sukumoe]|uniref:Uncharacterized protein n=1 Tax=Promicromonospora sukumoe TaxID=88382 RepID=A0A7W3PFL0_9MICO|nr:hypothetical protein [Promicromonospora sukumoe]MBA8810255.1 hypothetical protein [Promicromonospora sukumoe]